MMYTTVSDEFKYKEGITNDYEAKNEIIVNKVIRGELTIREATREMNKILGDALVRWNAKDMCSCGEPDVSPRVQHCFDGKPCFVKALADITKAIAKEV